jgi:flagellar hook assembly protein FlgD
MTGRHLFAALVACGTVPLVAHAQTLTIAPQQAYILECQETFVTLTGTNLTGTASTLVDFSGNGQLYELEPNTASSTQLVVWIPLGVAYATGDYSVTVKATDTGSGTRTIGPVTFSVVQRSANSPPMLSLPEVVTAETTSSSGTTVTYDAGGASCSPPSGSLFPVGTTTVTCSMSNGFGTTTGTFSVVVTNTAGSPPAFSLPEVMIAEATSAAGAVVTFNASPATCDHASGATYPLGDTTVTCSATNSFGTTTAVMTIAVLDTTPPVLNLPTNFTTSNAVVTYTTTATDAVDGSVPVSCSPPSGSTFPDGATVVQCSATDTRGNAAFGSFTVTVRTPQLSDFTASQNVYQLNAAVTGAVTYTSNVPITLTETLTIRSDATGQTVRTLFSGVRNAGTYQDIWDGKNDAGQLVADGTYRYFVTVSANGSSFTWDDSTRGAGTTITQYEYPMCRKADGTLTLSGECWKTDAPFDPYINKPLRLNYCVGGGNPPACSADTTPYLVVGKAVNASETDEVCRGTDCFFSEYQSSGAHEVTWYGRSIDGTFIGGATRLSIIRRNDTWPRNMTLVYGTAPSISSLTLSYLIFNPGGPNGEDFRMNVTTFQSRSVVVKGEFKNLTSGSVLRTMTTSSQPAGSVVLTWNGRADNGMWVAPGPYEATLTVIDSAGGSTMLKPIFTVRY